MTNEEAIKIISQMIKDEEGFLSDDTIEAHKMAIKALETIPKYKDTYYKGWCDGAYAVFEHLKMCEEEQSGDLISRQAVLDLMRSLTRWCVRSEDGKFNNVGLLYDDVMFGIDKLPPANPQEPKTGHWIEYTRVLIPEPFNSWEQAWYCSECGYGNQECVDGSAWLEWKYCPNCGARMAERSDKE